MNCSFCNEILQIRFTTWIANVDGVPMGRCTFAGDAVKPSCLICLWLLCCCALSLCCCKQWQRHKWRQQAAVTEVWATIEQAAKGVAATEVAAIAMTAFFSQLDMNILCQIDNNLVTACYLINWSALYGHDLFQLITNCVLQPSEYY
jgi:hypothetical protein